MQSGLSTTDAPPADKDEGPGEREQSRRSDHQHHVTHQRRVVRRCIHVKLTTTSTALTDLSYAVESVKFQQCESSVYDATAIDIVRVCIFTDRHKGTGVDLYSA